MKTLKKPLVLASTLIAGSLLVSWNLFDDSRTPTTFGLTSDDEYAVRSNHAPAAEDVLVQRIAGDNAHLLIMAYYSKERFSGQSVTINSGSTFVLTDDGKGDDKIAGDGLYTAKIPVDLAAFRSQALGLVQKMKAGKYVPITYLDRQRIMDPDAAENFDIKKFEANEPVSISGLTNALSADFGSAATAQTSMSANATANGTVDASVSLSSSYTPPPPPTLDQIKANSIFITALSVVEDPTRTYNYCTQTGNPNGAWTFGFLMRQLASKKKSLIATDAQVSDFVKNWFTQWTTQQNVNGDIVAARDSVEEFLINPWLEKSLAAGAPEGQLDMRFAPFKLTAITNRFDLRSTEPFGNGPEPCGEGRFVFTLIRSDCSEALKMNVIFEYRVNKPNTCDGKHAWAQQWVNLANKTLGSTEYNAALQKITDQFSKSGTNTSKPNQSSLSQLRTNEVGLSTAVFGGGIWELREFNLVTNKNTGITSLKMGTVKQAPGDRFNGSVTNPVPTATNVKRLIDFINQNQTAINNGFYTVPAKFQNKPFLGGASKVNGFPVDAPLFGAIGFHWDGSGTSTVADDNARFNFSLQTCSGCHAGESQTFFTHVDNVNYGTEATLSGFVGGKGGQLGFVQDADSSDTDGVFSVKDVSQRPAANPTLRSFNEIDRRARDLQNFVNTTCGTVLSISSELLFAPTVSVD